MIVPQVRLMWVVALAAAPLATAAAVAPAAAPVAWTLVGAIAAVAISDAAAALARRGASLGVECPQPVRLTRGRAGKLTLRLADPRGGGRRVRLGLPWPEELRAEPQELLVDLPAGAEHSLANWPVQGRVRGRFLMERCYVEARSPLGLWAVRGACPTHIDVRVYPNLATERKTLSALLLNRGGPGAHALRQVGKGREFEKLREYVRGDGYEDIHWKATAKRARPITKVFQVERTQEVYVILDRSRLSARRIGGPAGEGQPAEAPGTVLERFLTAGMVLALAAAKQGDLFGFLAFSDKVDVFVRARSGRGHYAACRDALYAVHPRIVTPDFDELCTFLRLRLRRRALLVFLTSLDDPLLAEAFVRAVRLICRQHLVLVNVLRAPGVSEILADADVCCLDDVYRALGGHLRWQQLQELQGRLRRYGVALVQLRCEDLSAELIRQYVGVKQRQLL